MIFGKCHKKILDFETVFNLFNGEAISYLQICQKYMGVMDLYAQKCCS
jgi:hypothetical protein